MKSDFWLKWAVGLLALGALATRGSRLEGQSSRYLPTDHWSGSFVEYLIGSGGMDDPSPLTRPYRRLEVLTRVNAMLEREDISEGQRRVGRMLSERLGEDAPEGWVTLDFVLQPGARSHARRDWRRAAGAGGFVFKGGGHGWIVQGPVVVSVRPRFDTNRDRDPDYGGKPAGIGGRPFQGRFDEAYLSFESSLAEVVFGNVERNWGPPITHGFLISGSPYSYTHLLVTVRTNRVMVQSLVSQLDDYVEGGERFQRYWVGHRFRLRLFDTVHAWFNQATLLSGVNRQIEPWALNPLQINEFTAEDERREEGTNSFLEWVLEVTAGGRSVVATLMVDDVSLFGDVDLPPRLGWLLAYRGPLAGGAFAMTYTGVSHLAYRSGKAHETAARLGVGLGRNFSDYDEITATWSMPGSGLSLWTIETSLIRQGEGDFRIPFPAPADFASAPFFLGGTVERTFRVAARYVRQFGGDWHIDVHGGLHFQQNVGHRVGETGVDPQGSVAVRKAFRVVF